MRHYDCAVIGTGPAGQKAALQAAKLGKRVAIVERCSYVGGAQINTGTIPSKALREAVLHLTGAGQRGLFGRSYRVKRKDWRGREREVELQAPLSVREFFPDSFRAAYRQKSRWALGIGLQGWHQIPWRGRSTAARYFLLHDRKGVVTSFIGIVAYVLLLQFVALHAGAAAGWWEQPRPELATMRGILEEAGRVGITLREDGLGLALERTLARLADRLAGKPDDAGLIETFEGVVSLARSLRFEVDFGKAQNAYYELTRTVLPVMRRSAEAGSASATQWVERFEALGEKLAVRVGGETDDPESERGDRRIAGEGHIG